jgi:hypothetical protein
MQYIYNKIRYIKDFSKESEYINSLKDMKFSLFGNFGKQLHGYKFINRDIINSVMIINLYLIDFLKSIVVIKDKYKFCIYRFFVKK